MRVKVGESGDKEGCCWEKVDKWGSDGTEGKGDPVFLWARVVSGEEVVLTRGVGDVGGGKDECD